MLEVSQLSRRYGDFLAVRDIAFSIGRGEIVGLLGHNGAGKTTIMKMLSGFLEPTTGRIEVAGFDLARDAKAAQRSLGYLPENLPVYPELTVADYLDYAAELKGIRGAGRAAELRRVVTATDIGEKLLSPIGTLSRGYKQRVGVAQAILGSPGLLILDEPTNGLDPTQTEHMRDLIRDIARTATVILSTHIMQEVEALCDRVLILSGGRLAIDARLDELRHSNHLAVATSVGPERFRELLEAITGIEHSEHLTQQEPGAHHRYRLTVAERDRISDTAADLARAIVTGGGELYALRTEARDLETLFREVSDAAAAAARRELDDAA